MSKTNGHNTHVSTVWLSIVGFFLLLMMSSFSASVACTQCSRQQTARHSTNIRFVFSAACLSAHHVPAPVCLYLFYGHTRPGTRQAVAYTTQEQNLNLVGNQPKIHEYDHPSGIKKNINLKGWEISYIQYFKFFKIIFLLLLLLLIMCPTLFSSSSSLLSMDAAVLCNMGDLLLPFHCLPSIRTAFK